ncbi:MAG: tripartite tricarboxylate transporter TctB family protein [Thermodesulfobacteriota bacterium]
MRKNYIINDIVFILLSTFICIGSLRLKGGIGMIREPGPGFMPFLAAMILGLLAFVDFISQLRARESSPKEGAGIWAGVSWPKIILAVFSLFFYTAVMDRLGFSLATTLYLMVFYRLSGVESWRTNVLASFVTTAIFYVGFKIGLECQLPRGFLGF